MRGEAHGAMRINWETHGTVCVQRQHTVPPVCRGADAVHPAAPHACWRTLGCPSCLLELAHGLLCHRRPVLLCLLALLCLRCCAVLCPLCRARHRSHKRDLVLGC